MRSQWLMLAFSFFIAFLLHLLLFSTSPMVSLIMIEMNLSYTEFGFIFSIAMAGLILFRIPWGFMGDRIGYINTLRIALPISAGAAVLRAFSPNYLGLLLGQFLLGSGLAVVLPCLPLIVKEWSPKTVGFSTGMYITGFAVGNAVALGLTPILLENYDWRTILLIYSCLMVLVSGLWWRFGKSKIKADRGENPI